MAASGGGAGEVPCDPYGGPLFCYLKDQTVVIIMGLFQFCCLVFRKQHYFNRSAHCGMTLGK